MKGFLGLCFLVCAGMSILALSQAAKDTPKTAAPAAQSKATIESPYLHSSLQRAQLPIRKSSGITPLQIFKDRLRFQPRVHLQ